MEITVLKNVLIKNNAIGNDNRSLFNKNKIFVANIISSPGAGKTTLLESTLAYLTSRYRVAVIEGDLYTSRDAKRLQPFNIPIVQINTEGGCHLDARMIHGAVQSLPLDNLDIILIENVGNLVCPASFDLGEDLRILMYAVTEGTDKPQKYANIFAGAEVILVNKVDLADLCHIDLSELVDEVRSVNEKAAIFPISALKQETLVEWQQFFEEKVKAKKNE
ncbi:MAG: hydrogenase nickel incorporation protein HypB [Oligoflexia bacterium]|nr:hydrogenase nickel incorporation protein HypB [Oligoflexia bacterium]MBF0367450.1 hydrogenase nickel incorporation protein HypB [Oligoflexia bacterium]